MCIYCPRFPLDGVPTSQLLSQGILSYSLVKRKERVKPREFLSVLPLGQAPTAAPEQKHRELTRLILLNVTASASQQRTRLQDLRF